VTEELIKVIVADIDGCFTGGGRADIDLKMVEKVAEYNKRSKTDPLIPHLIYCTGRPLPYIQAMQQMIGCHLPSISEFGAVIWFPDSQTHAIHPQYSVDDRFDYEKLLLEAEKEFTREESSVLIEAGKVCQLTLYPKKDVTMEQLIEETHPFVERHRDNYTVDYTSAVLNFLPNGVHKGTALDWVSKQIKIPMTQMAAIGDSPCDWRFMELCGISTVPANAKGDLKDKADVAFDSGPADCILDLYDYVIDHNRRVSE